jgi:hypothetical protein
MMECLHFGIRFIDTAIAIDTYDTDIDTDDQPFDKLALLENLDNETEENTNWKILLRSTHYITCKPVGIITNRNGSKHKPIHGLITIK